jgi:malonyl-CoA O-methyltransferase
MTTVYTSQNQNFSQTFKQRIADNFGRSAMAYHQQADLQRQGAQQLLALMTADAVQLPQGTILEIGCGTGFITQGLIQSFSQHPLKITDLSVEMLNFCRSRLLIPAVQPGLIQFEQLDGEQLSSAEFYAAIVSGFVFQWFKDPVPSLHRLIAQLQPGGYLFLSFPTADSFPEWRAICNQLQLPCTMHPLPQADQILQMLPTNIQVHYAQTSHYTTTHRNATDFLHSLKAIGAGMSPTQPSISSRQLKQLIQIWDAQSVPFQVQYSIAFWVIQRCF